MIIYGWGYFNRRDHNVVRDTCPACNTQGHFKSYTSSKFFTLYFVPVIPLGTEKVISECPHCKRALTMPLRKWTKLKNTELPARLTTYAATPADEEAASKLLGAIAGLHARSTLTRVSPQIRAAFARNPKILSQLAGTCSHLCLDKEADAVYLEAIALSSDEKIAAAADAHLKLQKSPKPRAPHRLWQSLPVMIVPAILVLLFASYLQDAVSARPKEAFLLNGLDQSYSVLINGQSVTLKPHQRVRADMLTFGENKIAPATGGEFIPATTFEIDVPWYRRAFDNTLLVVNPDQSAVLVWERIGYAYPKPPDNAGASYRFDSGAAHHSYQDIDFPFQIFPDTISTPADGSVIYRTRVSEFTTREPQKIVQLLLEEKQTGTLHRYLRAKLLSPDAGPDLLFLGANFLPRSEFLALAEPRLDARPVKIEWHRAYQTLVENTPEGSGLVARYRSYTEREPADSNLLYLYGRIVDDLDESRALFERAAQADKPSAHAANALAYYYILEGDFARALDYSRQALALDRSSAQFKQLRNDALNGLKDYTALEQEAGDLLAAKNPTYDTFYEHIYRLGKLGRADQAGAEITRFMDKLGKLQPLDTAGRHAGESYLKTALACAQQNRDALLLALTSLEGSGWDFQKSVLMDDLAGAAKLADKTPEAAGVAGRLVLYILFTQSQQPEAAARQLAAASAELAKGVSDQKIWAGWLSDATTTAPDPRIAAHTCYDADLHYLYLAALAQKYPSRASDYLARASAIKTRDSFYSLAISSLVK